MSLFAADFKPAPNVLVKRKSANQPQKNAEKRTKTQKNAQKRRKTHKNTEKRTKMQENAEKLYSEFLTNLFNDDDED
jgi:hypothetical protein